MLVAGGLDTSGLHLARYDVRQPLPAAAHDCRWQALTYICQQNVLAAWRLLQQLFYELPTLPCYLDVWQFQGGLSWRTLPHQ